MARGFKTAKGAKKACDQVFSELIRRHGRCENCGGINGRLECAHIISRRFSNTRVTFSNAFCLDSKCHHYFTDHPVEFGRFVENSWASKYYTQNLKKAHSLVKVDWEEQIELLRDAKARLDEGEITIQELRDYED